ncbi:MAG: ribosome biogenesis GTPase Der, partial [Finegoldia magna]|nr:ribosome biogenesis GTPase Der [Finegoldia magna]
MAKPVVAIVGRANVGKSTLFNKLIKKRIAITQDDPGVTRDRLYMEAEWQNKYFTVVDTGGLEPKSNEIITKNIKKQTELAIETADVILFMVDGKQGITPIDMEVADMLRRTKKSVILVVNKIDHIKQQDNVYDFYNLGFYEIFPISASNSMGLGDLLEAVVSKFDDNSNTESDDDITKVCLIGKPNVGKSSLINNLLNEERMIVTDIAGTTRDAIDSKIDYKGNEYIFIDTAGLRKRKKIDTEVERYSVVRTLSAIDRSDICVLMIDATEGVSEQDTKILGYAHDQGKAMIILVNKWDLVEKQTNTMNDFKKDIRTKLGFVMYVPIVFISVKENKRIDTLFTEIEKV